LCLSLLGSSGCGRGGGGGGGTGAPPLGGAGFGGESKVAKMQSVQKGPILLQTLSDFGLEEP